VPLLGTRDDRLCELIVAGNLNRRIPDERDIAERAVNREREQVIVERDAKSTADPPAARRAASTLDG